MENYKERLLKPFERFCEGMGAEYSSQRDDDVVKCSFTNSPTKLEITKRTDNNFKIGAVNDDGQIDTFAPPAPEDLGMRTMIMTAENNEESVNEYTRELEIVQHSDEAGDWTYRVFDAGEIEITKRGDMTFMEINSR